VKAPSGSGGLPWPQIAIAAGVLLIIGLIAYVVTQQSSGDGTTRRHGRRPRSTTARTCRTFVPRRGAGLNYTFSLERTPPVLRASAPDPAAC
jgi:hypothetical protein